MFNDSTPKEVIAQLFGCFRLKVQLLILRRKAEIKQEQCKPHVDTMNREGKLAIVTYFSLMFPVGQNVLQWLASLFCPLHLCMIYAAFMYFFLFLKYDCPDKCQACP